MNKARHLKDIPELAGELKALRARFHDGIFPQGRVEMVIDNGVPVLRAPASDGSDSVRMYGLPKSVHSQMSEKLFQKGGAYYQRLIAEAPGLLATNVNHWLKADAEKKRLLRFDGMELRAFLSDRFRIIDNLDILTTAVQVITGRDGQDGDMAPHARGAACFSWTLTPDRMDVCLVNPRMLVDMNHLERGVMPGVMDVGAWNGGGHDWLKPHPDFKTDADNGNGGARYVCPCARIGNSETGHGGVNVNPGLYEAICDNRAWMGINLAQVHVGRVLEMGDLTSAETLRKENAVIFSKVSDAVRAVFHPEHLLKNVRKMQGLAKEVVDPREAINRIAKLPGITEEIRDDILAAYHPIGGVDTLLDVQRAVTNAAHKVRERDEVQALELEELGGRMIEKGAAALMA